MLVFELQLGELLGVQVLEELRVVALKPKRVQLVIVDGSNFQIAEVKITFLGCACIFTDFRFAKSDEKNQLIDS